MFILGRFIHQMAFNHVGYLFDVVKGFIDCSKMAEDLALSVIMHILDAYK
jgi:hypothetical protein